jgi:hypothetical protein
VMTAHLLLFWSGRDLDEGRTDGVADACREALDRCLPLGRITEPAWARILLGRLALREGRAEEALALAEELRRDLAMPTPPPARIVRMAEEFLASLPAPEPTGAATARPRRT